ncbi:glycosyl hydrolase, partial [Cladorrhinum samala]
MLPILTLLHLFPLSTAHPQSTLGNRNFPDPSITYDPSTDKWYAFATQSDDDIHVQVASSSSFPSGSDWTYLPRTDILPVPGKWVNSSQPEIWAPDVHFVNSSSSGKWVMYYSGLASGSGYHCIGTASTASSSNASILGPYTADDEPFACPTSKGGAIDASGFYDEQDDARWVVYKVDGSAKGPGGPCGNGLPPGEPTPFMLQRVDARDGVTKVGEPIQILDRDPELDGPLIEAPSLVKHVARGGGDDDDDDNNDDHGRGGDRWVLFYSSHCFNS